MKAELSAIQFVKSEYLIAPIPPHRTRRRTAHVPLCKPFRHQNRPHIAALRSQESARPAEIALIGALGPWPARTRHGF
jgi:hypothetical protein